MTHDEEILPVKPNSSADQLTSDAGALDRLLDRGGASTWMRKSA